MKKRSTRLRCEYVNTRKGDFPPGMGPGPGDTVNGKVYKKKGTKK